MQLTQLNKLSASLAVMGLAISSWASPILDTPLQKRDTTFTRRDEKGVADIAGQWTAWKPGYLSQLKSHLIMNPFSGGPC